jgi:hypothetical protein
MKRLILTAAAVLTIANAVNSQFIDDALRYSQNFYGGTARAISMGNAFTSLGADLSAISLNPAGTAMFRSMEISFSPQIYYNSTSSLFNGTTTGDYRYRFQMPQVGIVGCLTSHDGSSGLVSLNFAYSYNQLNNYYENSTITGISSNSSMTDYWAGVSQGKPYGSLNYGSGLAYAAWLMDTITGSGGNHYGTIFSHYGDSLYSTYGQKISRVITDEGYKGEHAFSVAANISNRIYIGATLGITEIRYVGHYDHLESDVNNLIYDFKNFSYTNHLETNGTGYSFKLGVIFRPVEILRIGLAFHAPVTYRMHEYFYDNISSVFDNGDKYSAANEAKRYDYTLSTPLRLLGGLSLQLGKIGIISADYEYVDYSQAKFSRSSDGIDYSFENDAIKTDLKSATNIRLGAELRLGSLYLRGGYGLYGSAFAGDVINKNLTYNSVSCGLGLRQSNFYFDLAYCDLFSTQKYYMYDDPGYLQPATIKTNRNTFTATIGMKF